MTPRKFDDLEPERSGNGFQSTRSAGGYGAFFLGGLSTRAADIRGQLPWTPNSGNPPVPVRPGPWLFFTGAEGRAIEAIADRIIPPDPQTLGGKDAGCAVFIDRQMAGEFVQTAPDSTPQCRSQHTPRCRAKTCWRSALISKLLSRFAIGWSRIRCLSRSIFVPR